MKIKNQIKAASLLFIALCAYASTSLLSAQDSRIKLSGIVTNESGSALPGVVVVAKGTSANAVTAQDGAFVISVPKEAKELELSCLGLLSQTVQIGSRTVFDITMKEDNLNLQESVVVGYGTMIKRDLSSSVASVKSEALNERASAFNIMQSLAGKVAGVRTVSFSGRPGGSSSLRIRGMGSINAGSDPIYVMDGVIGIDPALISSSDIESIDVLKDAAATSIYGAQGSNGVVLITTKSGTQAQGTVTYESKVGFSALTRKIDLLDSDEYMEVQERAYAYSGNVMPHLVSPMENLFYYSKDAAGNYVYDDNGRLIASPKYNTDWQDVLTRNALVNDQTLSFNSGKGKTSVYASLSYQDMDGLIRYTDSKRMTGTLNAKSEINNWLDVRFVAQGGTYKADNGDSENGFNQGALRNMYEMPSIVPVQYEDGTYGRKNDYPLGEVAENPVKLLQNYKNISKTNFLLMSASADVKFTKELVLTVKGDFQTRNGKGISYAKSGLLDYTENNGGFADISNSDTKKWSNEDYFTFNHSFFDGKLRSSFVLGASWYYTRVESSSAGSEQFFDDSFEYFNLGAGTVYHKPSSSMYQNTMNSCYFRMNHSFLDKYLFGFTFRADGASNFGSNNKYGYFPSASAAWIVSEEPFFERAKSFVSKMKVRASYGSVGNASIPNYRTISQYSNGSTIFAGELSPYVVLSNLGNSDLKWETSTQLNLGLDLGLLKDRVEVIFDFYNKATTNMLFQKQVPYTTGYSTSWTNLGKIRNTGFEVTLTSHNFNTPDFSWDTDLVFSTNKIIVVDINGETLDLGNNVRAVEGKPWGSYFVLNRIGTWGLGEVAEAARYGKKPGDLKYEDVNKDYVIDDYDRQYMGSGTPKGEVSLVNTFRWKNLSLMVDLYGQYGAKLMNITYTMMENRQLYANSPKTVLDAWTPEHQNTMVAAIRRPSDTYFGENEKDSRMLYKGDFVRIKNIMLSYDIKSSLLKKFAFVRGLAVGVNIENPYVFTSYPGYDPEVGAFTNANTGVGIDFYSYPRPTTVTGNIKITF